MEKIKFEFMYTDGTIDSNIYQGCSPEDVESIEEQIRSSSCEYIEIFDNFYRKSEIRRVRVINVSD